MKEINIKDVICPDCGQNYRIREDEYDLMITLGDSWLIMKCPEADNHYMIGLRKKIDAVPKETKQIILDLMHKGFSVGEVRKKVKLELSVVSNIIVDNLESHSYLKRKVS